MKNVFRERAITQFFQLATDFGESLRDSFPDCKETRDWMLWITNIVGEDKERRAAAVAKWQASLNRPLCKGSARYLKAVQILTGSPATLYHAICYSDADAVHQNDEDLKAMDFPSKLQAPCMDNESRDVFWQYLREMCDQSFVISRTTPPKVPTPREIADDIARRKRGEQSSAPASMQQGLADLYTKLAVARGTEACLQTSELASRFATARLGPVGDTTLLAACQARHPEAQSVLLEALSPIGDDDFDEEQWSLCERMIHLSSMEEAIPSNMMRGIEDVASSLLKDLEHGKLDLANIDLEKIGQRVLEQSNSTDIDSFANNLDKIIPALDAMKLSR